jgi:hypothetical protein
MAIVVWVINSGMIWTAGDAIPVKEIMEAGVKETGNKAGADPRDLAAVKE